jgi:hypothetical protein
LTLRRGRQPSGFSFGSGQGGGSVASRPPPSQALALGTLGSKNGALAVIHTRLDAMGVAEAELIQIALKVLLAAVLIDAIPERPKA